MPIMPPYLTRQDTLALSFASIAAILLLSAASRVARSTPVAFSQRSFDRQSLLCKSRSGGRRLSHSAAASGDGGDLRFFSWHRKAGRRPGFAAVRRRATTSRMPLSDSNDGDFASFLDSMSMPTTLSEAVKDENGSPIHVIMGNEAGDADSIVSALSLGYVRSLAAATTTTAATDRLIVPIVSVPRADIALRRDVVLLMDLAGINVDNLLYVDDDVVARHLLPPSSPTPTSIPAIPPNVTLTLVDHNRMRSSLSHLSGMVTEIVDHHEDEGAHGEVASGKRVIAFEDGRATVASTCTLVAERLFELIDDPNNAISTIEGRLGLLLLGVILLDSVNMLPAAGKGTKRDEDAMRRLMEHADWSSHTPTSALLEATALDKIFPNKQTLGVPDRTALFEALSGAKNDPKFWASLSVTDCLRIDYKKFLVSDDGGGTLVSSIGLSSVLIDMDSLLSKPDFREDLASFLAKSDAGLFGIMSAVFRDGRPERELLLTGPDAGVVGSFAEYLVHHPDAAFLEIAEREDCVGGDGAGDAIVRVFRQGNGRGSRKQVAPVLLGHAVPRRGSSL